MAVAQAEHADRTREIDGAMSMEPYGYVVTPEGNTPSLPKITAVFECEENGVIGSTSATIKRVEAQDDGSYTVVIDHWPISPAPEAHQEPVAWQLRYGYGPWACEITQSREVVDRWVRDGHGFRPLYAHPAISPAPEAQQERPSEPAVTDAMELARAVLARVMTAGYPNAPGADPEDVEKAFWALDDALKAAMI